VIDNLSALSPLGFEVQYPLALVEAFWMASLEVAKKRVDRCQSLIASVDTVLAHAL
jgi:hypothetical protein